MPCATVVFAASTMFCFGCSSSRVERQHLSSPYPLDRAQAAVKLADAGDPQAVDLLIDLLEDPDRGVRMYSILALERLCGQTYGYRYYDPEPVRAAAVRRWREARQRGEVTVCGRSREQESRKPSVAVRADDTGEGSE